MKRIVLFLCVLVFSIFSNTNNLLANEIENKISQFEPKTTNLNAFKNNIEKNLVFSL